jgi:hypothetical protein
MSRTLLRFGAVAIIFLSLGAAGTAAVVGFVPDAGSAPSIYDDFSWDSIANSFWHVNADGATATIKHSLLTLIGHSIELDRRVQTDPNETVISARVRGIQLHKFGIGIGVYHAGTVAEEFDNDGIKCGRGTDHGWQVDYVKGFLVPPNGQWFTLRIAVINPYPNPKAQQKASQLDPSKRKKTTVLCTAWDASGHLIAAVNAKDPVPNTQYVGLDEAFFRTWDSGNNYQLDWFYAGPPSNDPTRVLPQPTRYVSQVPVEAQP